MLEPEFALTRGAPRAGLEIKRFPVIFILYSDLIFPDIRESSDELIGPLGQYAISISIGQNDLFIFEV